MAAETIKYHNSNIATDMRVISQFLIDEDQGLGLAKVNTGTHRIREISNVVILVDEKSGKLLEIGLDVFLTTGIFGEERFTVVEDDNNGEKYARKRI